MESSANRLNASPHPLRAGLFALLTGCIALVLTACEPSPASQALSDQRTAFVGQPPEPPSAAAGDVAAPSVVIEELSARIEPSEPEIVTESAYDDLAPGGTPLPADSGRAAGPSPGPGDVGPPAAIRPAAMMMPVDKPGGFELLGETIPAGTSQRLMWSASQIFEGVSSETPVLVVNGKGNGPTLCLTAAIHGDELNGIEMVRRVLHDLDPDKVNGTVIGIPIVNLQGFRRGSRYLPDRRDLNRYFPGNPEGSSASRIAHSLFDGIIRHCDALVDLHTGSFYRTNMPQLRADLRYERIKEMTQGFGGIAVLHSEAALGTLRRAAADAGIPAITLEAGEPLRLQSSKVSQGVTGIFTLLDTMNIVKRVQFLSPPEPVFYQSTWVRADDGGILFSVVRLGQSIETGDVLGTITDPITNEQNLIYSPARGRVLGMALNQVVQPGFAAFRIGIETDGPPTESAGGDLAWVNENRMLGDNTVTGETDPQPADVETEENSEE